MNEMKKDMKKKKKIFPLKEFLLSLYAYFYLGGTLFLVWIVPMMFVYIGEEANLSVAKTAFMSFLSFMVLFLNLCSFIDYNKKYLV